MMLAQEEREVMVPSGVTRRAMVAGGMGRRWGGREGKGGWGGRGPKDIRRLLIKQVFKFIKEHGVDDDGDIPAGMKSVPW